MESMTTPFSDKTGDNMMDGIQLMENSLRSVAVTINKFGVSLMAIMSTSEKASLVMLNKETTGEEYRMQT